ncbi:MAG: excalibur calcium-binding domain-containing protein [Chloroflexota bacterium]
MGIKEDFDTALELARQGELVAARKLLLPHQGNEQADKLLNAVNKKIIEKGVSPTREKSEKGRRTWSELSSPEKAQGITALLLTFVCGLCSIWIIFLPESPTSNIIDSQAIVPTINTHPVVEGTNITNEYSELENRINDIGQVNRVNNFSVFSDSSGAINFYVEVMVDYGVNYRQIANDILDWTVFELPEAEFSYFSVILDDRYTAMDYVYDIDALGWIVTPLDSYNATRAYLATDTPTPRPRPTSRPSSSNNGDNQSQIQWSCSGNIYNCDSFSSCGEMRSYFNACAGDPSELDADNDGIPCERTCQ